jgi:uncharacterized protein YkwD
MKTAMGPRTIFIAAMVLLAVAARSIPLSAQTAADPDEQKQIRQFQVNYRAARDAARRVAAVRGMVELGPAGVEGAEEFLERELDRLGRPVAAPPPTAELDARIAEMRKILADLRADPNLTKEQTKDVGLPALDELTVIWRRHQAVLDAHYLKLGRTREQIAQFVEFLEAMRGEAAGGALPVDETLAKAEELLAKATKPEDPEVRRVMEENVKLAAEIDPREVAGMQALNAMRIMCGLRPLLYDPKLCDAARGHSADMEKLGFFAHESPVAGKTTFGDRARLAGTTSSGENIYMGSGSPVDALKGWFLSPGHHKNMLSEGNTRQGLGRVGRHWTQMFGR